MSGDSSHDAGSKGPGTAANSTPQTLYQSKGVLCISWCQSGYCFPAKPWKLVFNKVVAVVYSYPARAARAG